MSAHDRHLAGYRHHITRAYCTNRECEDYGQPVTVDYQEEYGQGSIEPEECDYCHGDLSLDMPPDAL